MPKKLTKKETSKNSSRKGKKDLKNVRGPSKKIPPVKKNENKKPKKVGKSPVLSKEKEIKKSKDVLKENTSELVPGENRLKINPQELAIKKLVKKGKKQGYLTLDDVLFFFFFF